MQKIDGWTECQSDKPLEMCRNKGCSAQETIQQTPKVTKSLNIFKDFEPCSTVILRIE